MIPKNTSIIVRRVPVTRAVSHIQNLSSQASSIASAGAAKHHKVGVNTSAVDHAQAGHKTQSKAAILLGTNQTMTDFENNNANIDDVEFGGDAMTEAHKEQQEGQQNQPQHKEDDLISNMVSQSAMDWRQEVRDASAMHGRRGGGFGSASGGRGRGRGQLGGEIPPSWYICNR